MAHEARPSDSDEQQVAEDMSESDQILPGDSSGEDDAEGDQTFQATELPD